MEREQLAVRLREDYGLDLGGLDSAEASADELAERAEVDAKIADLRHKLGNIGTVNMDALDELDQVVLKQLDGTRDRAQLIERLVELALADEITVRREGQPLRDREALASTLGEALDFSMRRLAGLCLLEA